MPSFSWEMTLRRKEGISRVSMESSPVVTSKVKSTSGGSQVEGVLEELRRECDTPAELLWLLIDGMIKEMTAGLAVEGGSKDFKMIISHVDKLPSGYVQFSSFPYVSSPMSEQRRFFVVCCCVLFFHVCGCCIGNSSNF